MLISSLALLGAAMLSVVVADPIPPVANHGACKPVKSPGSTCGKQGSLGQPNQYLTDLVSPYTLRQCIDACLAMGDDYCTSFSFGTNPINCNYYYQNVSQQDFTKGKTGVAYHDAACYECNCDAHFDNGGFDTGRLHPRQGQNLDNDIAAPGYKSKYAMGFQLQPQDGETPTQGNFTQPVHMCSGQTYTIAFAYNIVTSPTSSGCITVYAGQYPDGANYVDMICPQADEEWHTESASYTADSDNQLVTFSLTNSDTDNSFNGLIDSVTIT